VTTESQQLEMRQQRSARRPVIAPDIRAQNRVAQAARAEDRKDAAHANINQPRVSLNKPLDIGTDAVYATLPNNAGRLNESQLWTFNPV